MLERLLRPLLTWRRLDLRSSRARLAALAARHVELSAVSSLDDDPARPSARLLRLALAAAERARSIELTSLAERSAPDHVFLWPGEHYRLLAAVVEVLRPRTVIEVGTFQGLSALAMLERLPPESRLTTFDILPWNRIEGSFLRREDVEGERLETVTADLGRPQTAARYSELLRRADLVFLDAAKDGALEQRLLDHLEAAGLRPGAIVILDDIRLWNMLEVWRGIRRPKLDLTSFGHWSGTGLVDWQPAREDRS